MIFSICSNCFCFIDNIIPFEFSLIILASKPFSIETKNNEFKELESHNNKYLEASTLLKSAPEESKIKDEIYTISGNIRVEEDKLKEFIASDSQLSLEISEEKLNELINEKTSGS